MEVPQLRTLDDVAERLVISRRSVEKLIASGQLASVKIGKSRRVSEDDLAAYIDGLRSGDAA